MEGASSQSDAVTKAWIFQGNLSIYKNITALNEQDEEFWNIKQNKNDIKVGHRVLIWISGQNGGIYALGTIITPPVLREDSDIGKSYWIDPIAGKRVYPRVTVRYDRKFLKRPLSRRIIELTPGLESLSILKQPRGTNFKVTQNEWEIIKELIEPDLAY